MDLRKLRAKLNLIMRELSIVQTYSSPGFAGREDKKGVPLDELLQENVQPEDVRFALQQLGSSAVIVLDEFDRVTDKCVASLMADTIKSLSDHSVATTLVIIGVADSIESNCSLKPMLIQ